jgi:hypothetical protein
MTFFPRGYGEPTGSRWFLWTWPLKLGIGMVKLRLHQGQKRLKLLCPLLHYQLLEALVLVVLHMPDHMRLRDNLPP